MKRAIKTLVGEVAFLSGLTDLMLRSAGVVVAFHRVQDRFDPSGLSVSAAAFERYCAFFARHFQVVPLGDLVDRLHRREPVGGRLAITFDDGYLDNYENALPILERFGLHATFFTVSRWIGTGVVPWWDREQGVAHPWMTWGHLRDLRQRGFHVGAHTRTHVDLGVVAGAEAEREIVGGRLDLESRLEATVDLFAVPYGRRRNISGANRALIKASGYRCCCLAEGGVNRAGGDPYDLQRIAVSGWYATPRHFGAEVAFGRTVLTA